MVILSAKMVILGDPIKKADFELTFSSLLLPVPHYLRNHIAS